MIYSGLRQSPRMDLSEAVPLDRPLTVYIEPTSRCNLACNFCPQSLEDYEERGGARKDMDLSLFYSLCHQIAEMQIKSLKLYFFGEPLLHPQIDAMLKLAAVSCERVELTTNGMPMTRKNCQAILDSGLHYLRISLYYEKPNLVSRNIDMLMAMKREQNKTLPFVAVKVFDRESAALARGMYEGIVDEVIIEGLHTIGSEFVQISQQPKDDRKACPYPFYNLVIKSSGIVVPCCVAWEDSLIIGDANKQTLKEIWESEELARIHRLHLDGKRGELSACRSCDTLFNSPDNIDQLTSAEYERRRNG